MTTFYKAEGKEELKKQQVSQVTGVKQLQDGRLTEPVSDLLLPFKMVIFTFSSFQSHTYSQVVSTETFGKQVWELQFGFYN